MKKDTKDTYCSHCGTLHSDEKYPKNCEKCKNITYRNPLPVAVGIVPVVDANFEMKGFLIIRRNTDPRKGGLAFPAGFIEMGESWEQGLVREVYEETNVVVSHESVKIVDVKSNPNNTEILIFGITQPVQEKDIDFTFTNMETSEIKAKFNEQLCFPLVQEVYEKLTKEYKKNE